MFDIQGLLQMASQNLMQKFVGSDMVFGKYKEFCEKNGLGTPSRAEFDGYVAKFNNTSEQDKMNMLKNMDQQQLNRISQFKGF